MTSSPALIRRDAHGKALALNLDPLIYGTLAEIGAGQEVARWFLGVGAASGTVAKSISAYDKVVSDAIYGAGTRYVSKERLLAMLDCEYKLLQERLNPARGKDTRFFVFADTVAVRNYQGTNQQHGWLGIRFQSEPGAQPSQMLLHINLRDSTAQLQQQAIGILGVNLVYAAPAVRGRSLLLSMPARIVAQLRRERQAGFFARRRTGGVAGLRSTARCSRLGRDTLYRILHVDWPLEQHSYREWRSWARFGNWRRQGAAKLPAFLARRDHKRH